MTMKYQDLLNEEFEARLLRNKSYSIRAYARDLGVSQPYLWQILAQHRRLSDEKALLMSERLRWKNKKKTLFVNLVRLDSVQDPKAKTILLKEISAKFSSNWKAKILEESFFNLIANWYYYAIMELTQIKGFRSNVWWIAKKLGISTIDAQSAVDRLKSIGLLSDKNGILEKTESDYIFGDVPSEAIRQHHYESLDLARGALEKQSLAEREFISVTLALDPAQLVQAKEKIKEFYKDFMAEFEKSQKKAIYKMSIQLFRLDRKNV